MQANPSRLSLARQSGHRTSPKAGAPPPLFLQEVGNPHVLIGSFTTKRWDPSVNYIQLRFPFKPFSEAMAILTAVANKLTEHNLHLHRSAIHELNAPHHWKRAGKLIPADFPYADKTKKSRDWVFLTLPLQHSHQFLSDNTHYVDTESGTRYPCPLLVA